MSTYFSVVIIEDEPPATAYLSDTLKKYFNGIKIIGTSDNVKDSITLLNNHTPELVFMDIELIDGNSFEILDTISNYDFEVIFITAHSSYIKKSMEYYAFNFITKPIDSDQLQKATQRYLSLKNRLFSKQKYLSLKEFLTESRLLIHTGEEHIAVNTIDIIKCEADGNYSIFLMTNKSTHLVSKPLKYYENLLSEKGFFRANRSTLINVQHIKSIYKKEAIILTNKEKVIISVRNKPKLSELIKNLS